jgi:protein SCO1
MDIRRALAVIVILVAGCGEAAPATSPTPYAWHGATLVKAVPMPDLVLTDDNGRPYNLLQQGSGDVTLVYVGYTHCPDVCPTVMAQLALALRAMPAAERARIRVVFITDDPARDTPDVVKDWLDKFDSSFIGLIPKVGYATLVEVQLHITPSVLDTPNPSGGYGVEHSAFVLVFTPDQLAHISFVEGMKTADEISDLTRLVQHGYSP